VRPDPKTELEYTNPYTLLVAVVLSAQATDKGVNRATGPLFQIADTPKKMLKLGEEKVADHIKTIGLWRNKAKNVIALSQALIDEHKGEGAARARSARGPARRRPQDRKRRADGDLRRRHDCG
jgi:endonuclease-3